MGPAFRNRIDGDPAQWVSPTSRYSRSGYAVLSRSSSSRILSAIPLELHFLREPVARLEGHDLILSQRALRVVVQVHLENRKTAVLSAELEDLGNRDGLPVPLVLGSLEIHKELLAGLLGHRASAR